jgi:class 3 adenylate cyclase
VDFDRSVELTFRPAPHVRQVNVNDYCVGSPQRTPHIVVQQVLEAGERREVRLSLEAGIYRLRRWGASTGSQVVRVAEGSGRTECRLDGASGGEVQISTQPSLTFENRDTTARVMILERLAWNDQAATAADVTAQQVFRELFSTEALRPAVPLAIDNLTVMFTDVENSSSLYRRLGDAAAFDRILQQHKILAEAVEAEGCAVVKTIGERALVVFRRPLGAVRAALKAQRALASPIDPLRLKIGIHAGPAIAVTLNDRLDYFGATVNTASRLSELSDGADLIASRAVAADSEVNSWLALGGVSQQPEEAIVGADSVEICRLRALNPTVPAASYVRMNGN